MSDAPERVWVEDERPIGGTVTVGTDAPWSPDEYVTEYVRADRLEAIEAENRRLKGAASFVIRKVDKWNDCQDRQSFNKLSAALDELRAALSTDGGEG